MAGVEPPLDGGAVVGDAGAEADGRAHDVERDRAAEEAGDLDLQALVLRGQPHGRLLPDHRKLATAAGWRTRECGQKGKGRGRWWYMEGPKEEEKRWCGGTGGRRRRVGRPCSTVLVSNVTVTIFFSPGEVFTCTPQRLHIFLPRLKLIFFCSVFLIYIQRCSVYILYSP